MPRLPRNIAAVLASLGLFLALAVPVAQAAPAEAKPRPVPVHISIVGGEDVVFSGLVRTRPQEITTPSGGTHTCDGTNAGANPHPGGTPTTALNDASVKGGFAWDGLWFEEFEDFLVTEIAGEAQTEEEFWHVAVNGESLQVGGCQFLLSPFDRVVWEFIEIEEDA